MKARVIKTGEIIDVVPKTNPNTVSASDILYTSDYRTYKGWELDFINIEAKHIDWEQRRYEIAKAVLHGIWSDTKNKGNGYGMTQYEWYSSLARKAVMQTNALIEELKKNNNGKED